MQATRRLAVLLCLPYGTWGNQSSLCAGKSSVLMHCVGSNEYCSNQEGSCSSRAHALEKRQLPWGAAASCHQPPRACGHWH